MRDKWFLKSKTLWGGLIAFLPAFLGFLGVDAPAELGDLGQSGLAFLDAANEVVGVLMLIWGRYTATRSRLTMLPA